MENTGNFTVDFINDNIDGTTTVYYDFNWVKNTSEEYNHKLAKMVSQFAMLGYDKGFEDETKSTGYDYTKPNLKIALENCGFKNIEINATATRDEVNYFIAQRPTEVEGKKYNLVFAAFIGSYTKQWYSNFDPFGTERITNDGYGYAGFEEKGKVHLGFADAREYVYDKLIKYIKRNPDDGELKLLLTGHSRGAAVANLLAAKLIVQGKLGDIEIDKDNIFTYCYATPNGVILSEEEKNNPDFKRIFSIVNPEDFVTEVLPEAWGFGKYGTVYTLPSKSNNKILSFEAYEKVMQDYYKRFKLGKEYHPFKKGTDAVDKISEIFAMGMENLESYYTKEMKELFDDKTPFDYFMTTLCPYVACGTSDEDIAAKNECAKLLLLSAYDFVGTDAAYRNISRFFVQKEGFGGITNNRVSSTYFSDSHRPETYCAYMMAVSKEAFLNEPEPEDTQTEETSE
ncbi:MAG: hypothetical protein IJT65_03790 [Eubacterium sp.]|nr:hypothetical protein [Eubacterium sp.]